MSLRAFHPAYAEADPALAAFIARLPKTETHLHLEGAVPWELLRELDPAKFNTPPPFWDPAFRYDSFEHFLQLILDYAAPWYTSAEHYGKAAELVLAECRKQNVKYVETSIHLAAVVHASGSGPEIIAAVKEAAAKAAPGMEVRVFLGLNRDDYGRFPKEIVAAVNWEGLDGLDLHGVETIPLQEWTAGVWRQARDNGKFTKAHAGEFGPASFVREAVEVLGVTRIEHGVRAAEDPEVMALLRDRGVTLDVCPVSNLKLKVAPSIREHQIGVLHRAGVRCTVNTDDPFFFGNRLEDEYAALALDAGFSRRDLATLARNGFEAAVAGGLMHAIDAVPFVAEIENLALEVGA
jgi:adenosine deaminase